MKSSYATTSRSLAPRAAAQTGLLILSSVLLLTLAAAPFGQWYLAWIGLAPWLVAVGQAPTMRAALWRGWLGGILYFAVNLWWLWTATVPGTITLILYFALYWALAAGLLRQLHLLTLDPRPSTLSAATLDAFGSKGLMLAFRILAIAVVWVAAEWLRCYVAPGFPWLPLGSTQSPLPLMCQVADIGGPWIVSFWVTLPNALLATAWIKRHELRLMRGPLLMVATMLALVAVYGAWRIETTTTTIGPRVMVLQSNFPHLPGGAPTVDHKQAVEFYLSEIENSLTEKPADLVILPEAALPPINEEARAQLARAPVGPFLEDTHQKLLEIARKHRTTLVIGGNAVTGWTTQGTERVGTEIRNSAYFYDPRAQRPVARYDKIYLARFSERAPLTSGPQWLRRLTMSISASRASQPMHAGELGELQPFRLHWSAPSSASDSGQGEAPFIAPICLENIDPAVVARMTRDPAEPQKRAQFIANLSNDGWFATQQKHQHLQTTILRCIENRVPMARSSNTGISGFIDSVGRMQETIAPGTAGFAVRTIGLDRRITFYTRYGDVFAITCVALVAAGALWRIAALMISRR